MTTRHVIAPPTAKDSKLAKASSETLAHLAQRKIFTVAVNGKEIRLPGVTLHVLKTLLSTLAKGDAVALTPIHRELTTQEAADLLGVSRPFLVKQLDAGKLPSHKVGTHRRLLYRDLMLYRQRMRKKSFRALDKLTAEGQELGMGY
jgi:excisionase family DNA binding protein